MKGFEWLARSLKASGQTHFFFVDAVLRRTLLELERVGVQPVLAHTEKAAVYMADAYARVSGRRCRRARWWSWSSPSPGTTASPACWKRWRSTAGILCDAGL